MQKNLHKANFPHTHVMAAFGLFCALALAPVTHALTNGPAMPEYNDFESIENTDLVNLATGDFSYSIPLMTVPGPGLGFPLVLNYHAGIMPEQEASWVGLGWNLQGGAITRRVNSIPDDFSGTLIREEIFEEKLHGWMASIGWNGATVGVSWDSENGLGGMVGYSYGPKADGPMRLGVGATAGFNGVYQGVGVSMSVGVGKDIGDARGSIGMSVGIHSERGVTTGIGAAISVKSPGGNEAAKSTSLSLANIGVSLSSSSGINAGASLAAGGSLTSTVTANVSSNSVNLWLPAWTPWTGYMEFNWGSWDVYVNGLQEDRYYGFLYSNDKDMGCDTLPNLDSCYKTDEFLNGSDKRVRKMEFNNSIASLREDNSAPRFGNTAEDIYSVQTQGISGVFRPFRAEDGDYYTFLTKNYNTDRNCESIFGDLFGAQCPRERTIEFSPLYEKNRNRHGNPDFSPASKVVWRFNSELAGGLYSPPAARDGGYVVSAASNRIEPLFRNRSIVGWRLTKENGVQYLYTSPQFNYATLTLSSGGDDLLLKKPTKQKMPNYAYAWLLTAVLSTDYVAVGSRTCESYDEGLSICLPQQGDLGGWVRLKYTAPKTYFWNSNAKSPTTGSPTSYKFSNGTDGYPVGALVGESYSLSKGVKSFSYLDTIETPTHIAKFIKSDGGRLDGIPSPASDLGVSGEIDTLGASAAAPDECIAPSLTTLPVELSAEIQFLKALFPVEVTFGNENTSVPKQSYKVTGIDVEDGTHVYLTGTTNQAFLRKRWRTKKIWGIPFGVEYKVNCTEEYRSQNLGRFRIQNKVAHKVNNDGTPISGNDSILELGDFLSVNASLESLPNNVDGMSSLQGIALINKSRLGQYSSPESTQTAAAFFEYDYSLSENTPNSQSKRDIDGGEKGKLSLRTVRLGATTLGPWQAPYVFQYQNAPYTFNADKWGYRSAYGFASEPNGMASMCNINSIETPSGQVIGVEYEPKTIDYVGEFPIIMGPTEDLGKRFNILNGTISFDWAKAMDPGTENPLPFSDDIVATPANMPIEIKQRLDGKYKVLVSNFDVFEGKPVSLQGVAPANLYGNVPPDSFIVEMPKIRVSSPNGYAFTAELGNLGGLVPISSGRLATGSGSDNVDYVVGYKATALPVSLSSRSFKLTHSFISNPGNIPITTTVSHTSTPFSGRIWAVYGSDPASGGDFVHYGGGVRAKRISFRDIDGQTNVAEYKYFEAATPSLPSPMAYHKTDYLRPTRFGYNEFIGNPAILHGEVRVTFRDGADSANTIRASTNYFFVTSKDLPVRFAFTDENNATNISKIRVYDRSGIWGSMWKKEEREAVTGALEKSELSQWAQNLAQFSSDPQLEDSLVRDGKTLLAKTDLDVFFNASVHGQSPNIAANSDYFGIEQKLFSHRFARPECMRLADGDGQKACLLADDSAGVASTQMEVLRFSHFLRKQNTLQDGMSSVKEKNYYDFLTGMPLVEFERRDSTHYLATLKKLAYHNTGTGVYSHMRAKNMLTQEFSNTVFDFESHPGNRNFGALNTADRDKVVASEFTDWSLVPAEDGGAAIVARMTESFRLKSKASFALPDAQTSTGAAASSWQTEGRNTRFDAFGHVTEFRNALGQFNTQIYGHRQSLPIAFAANAKRNDVFHKSFEDEESNLDPMPNVAITLDRFRTGEKSLRVLNCRETDTAGAPITKPDCDSPDFGIACFELGNLDASKKYQASAWYYDEFKGSDSTIPALKNRSYRASRPGIFLGSQPSQCMVETHPNGAIIVGTTEQLPAGPSRSDYQARSTGSRTWKRISIDLDPSACPGVTSLSNSMVCLYASKGKAGSDVVYDEVRVHPIGSLMSTFGYDQRGNMISAADANGIVKRYDYDKFGNLKGIRNDDGVILSEQAKKYRNVDIVPFFKDREPSAFPDSTCLPPLFSRNGVAVPVNYEMTNSSDTLVAKVVGTNVCTYDYSGTSNITLYVPDLGRNVVVPIRVTGSQVAAQVFHCRDIASILNAVESGLTPDEIKDRVAARVHCQFSIESLKTRSLTRTGIRPTGYGLTLELLHTKATPVGPGNWMEREGDNVWTCMEGADSWGSSETPCVYPEMHAHIRFSDHKLIHPHVGNAIRPTFASAFPNLDVANRFKGSMTMGLLKYLIISNNTTNPNVPYAPSLFRFSFPNGVPVSDIQDDLDSPGGILKIEYGIADTVPSTPVNLQVDFSLNAVTEISGRPFKPKSLSYRDVNTSVPVTEGTRTPPQRGVLITVRAYEKK